MRDGSELHAGASMEAAARQYVRKVSGFREPASHNRQAFEAAVAEIAAATEKLMAGLTIRGAAR